MSEATNTIQANAHMWRARVSDGLDTEEQRAFDAWLDADPEHFDAYTEAESFWGRVGQPDVQTALANAFPAPAAAPPKTAASIRADLTQENRVSDALSGWVARVFGLLITAAACLAVFFALGGPQFLQSSDPPRVQIFATKLGETRTIALSDRTRITLGASSRMELELTDQQRRVRLIEGEGYFDVARNRSRPFVVTTDVGRVEVTGTQFDVRLHPLAMDVGVGEGRVNVTTTNASAAGASSADLKAGEGVRVTLDGGVSPIFEVFPAEFAAWRKGRLIYVRAPLSQVIEDINRYSSAPVRLGDGVEDIEFSGTFDADNIEGLLKSIQEGSPVEMISRDGARVLVRR
ncbi:MAG: FecR domain-containing protein [Pseudomonadota bacterium]